MNLETGSSLSICQDFKCWNNLRLLQEYFGYQQKGKKRKHIAMLHCVCQCYSLTPSLFNYCNICPGQHTTQQVSKLARTTKQREASSHVELMAPILQTPCKAWKSLSPPAHQCAPALIHPTPGRLPLVSPELLDTFISLAMLAPLKQKQEKAMNIP